MAELWEAELLDSLILVNVVTEITELWVENSKKISCCDVTSIWKGRAFSLKHFCGIYLKAIFFISYTN